MDVDSDFDSRCGHGIVDNDAACFCYVGWFGDNCDQRLADILPKAFMGWRVMFAVISVLFTLYSGYTIFKSRTKYVVLKGNTREYRNKWTLTSKKLIIFLIFLLNLSKGC